MSTANKSFIRLPNRSRGSRLVSFQFGSFKTLGNLKNKQVRTFQPTYQIASKKPFDAEVVQKIVANLVDSELELIEYNDKVIPELCISLSESIRAAVKEENYDRYRIIVAVTMGQKRQQSVQIFHSFLWDPEKDNFVTHSFENCHIYANAVVYGIYLD